MLRIKPLKENADFFYYDDKSKDEEVGNKASNLLIN